MKKRSPERRSAAARPAAQARRVPTYDDLLAIARLVESGSRFTEFRLRSGDIEVEVKRANGVATAVAPASAGAQSPTTLPPPPPKGGGELPDLPAGTHLTKSPMVGTFYRSPEPGAKPFVEPGRKVKPDTIVCIIEVMKLMNSVEAGVAGTATHVFVENAA